ncbi:MAG: hypothetical protein WC666_01935 [Candidatus Paceibacterota bacterium]|jgi:hypothetical protein
MPRQNRDARRQNEKSRHRTEKEARMIRPSGRSRYALKADNGGSSIWVKEPASSSTEVPRISPPLRLQPDQELTTDQFVPRRLETPRTDRSIWEFKRMFRW